MAIEKEVLTARFFEKLASEQQDESITELLKKYAKVEMNHKRRLEKVKSGLINSPDFKSIMSYNIAEDIDIDAIPDQMSEEDVLKIAIKMEHMAYTFYLQLAADCQDEELTDLFLLLAQEEAKHRFAFEKRYAKNEGGEVSLSGSISV